MELLTINLLELEHLGHGLRTAEARVLPRRDSRRPEYAELFGVSRQHVFGHPRVGSRQAGRPVVSFVAGSLSGSGVSSLNSSKLIAGSTSSKHSATPWRSRPTSLADPLPRAGSHRSQPSAVMFHFGSHFRR